MDILSTINFLNNYEVLTSLLEKYNKQNEEKSTPYITALTEIFFYVNQLGIENREYKAERKREVEINRKLRAQLKKAKDKGVDYEEFFDV